MLSVCPAHRSPAQRRGTGPPSCPFGLRAFEVLNQSRGRAERAKDRRFRSLTAWRQGSRPLPSSSRNQSTCPGEVPSCALENGPRDLGVRGGRAPQPSGTKAGLTKRTGGDRSRGKEKRGWGGPENAKSTPGAPRGSQVRCGRGWGRGAVGNSSEVRDQGTVARPRPWGEKGAEPVRRGDGREGRRQGPVTGQGAPGGTPRRGARAAP